MTTNKGHWKSPFKLEPLKYAGFVYLIVDERNNRKYIGKKHFTYKKGPRKGKEHPWRTYTSSSKFVNELIKEHGKGILKFYIIEQYETIGALSWAETWTQTTLKIPENNDEFMNRYIDKVGWKVTENITSRHERRLRYLLNKYKYKG